MSRPNKYDNEKMSKPYTFRLSKGDEDWIEKQSAPMTEILRSALHYYRIGRDDEMEMEEIWKLKERKNEIKVDMYRLQLEESLIDQKIAKFEGKKEAVQEMKLNDHEARLKLLEEYTNRGERYFKGWLTGPLGEKKMIEAGFSNPAEAVDFCEAEFSKKK